MAGRRTSILSILCFVAYFSQPGFSSAQTVELKNLENPYGGVGVVWSRDLDRDLALDYVDIGQIVRQWKWAGHSAPGQFDFRWLDDELERLDKHNVRSSIQINGNRKPDWLYEHVPYLPYKVSHQISDSQGTIMYWHPFHMQQMTELMQALKRHLDRSPHRHRIIGVRVTYNAAGAEHSLGSDDQKPLEDWVVPPGARNIPNPLYGTEYSNYRQNIVRMAYGDVFYPDYYIFARASSYDAGREPTVTWVNSGRAGLLTTGSDMEPATRSAERRWYLPFMEHARPGNVLGFSESFANSEGVHAGENVARWATPEQWVYWRGLVDLHRGASFIAYYADDIRRSDNAEFVAAFRFIRKYAGFHAKPSESPGAFVAFRHGKVFEGDYTFLMEPTQSADFTALDLRDDPAAELGNQSQRFGAYARKLSADKTVTISVNPEFSRSVRDREKTLSIVYLSRGNGTLLIEASVSGFSKAVGNTGNWERVSFSVPAGTSVDSVRLTAHGAPVTLHMLEIERVGGGIDAAPKAPPAMRVE